MTNAWLWYYIHLNAKAFFSLYANSCHAADVIQNPLLVSICVSYSYYYGMNSRMNNKWFKSSIICPVAMDWRERERKTEKAKNQIEFTFWIICLEIFVRQNFDKCKWNWVNRYKYYNKHISFWKTKKKTHFTHFVKLTLKLSDGMKSTKNGIQALQTSHFVVCWQHVNTCKLYWFAIFGLPVIRSWPL